jgi:hypothetical protein
MFNEPESLSNAPNSPELNGKLLGKYSSDFAKVSEQIKEANYQIRTRGFSEHPIFVVSAQVMPIGSLFLAQMELEENQYNYYASMVQEFLDREIIAPDAHESFLANYKDPNEYCCLFIMDAEFSGFVYVPYPEDGYMGEEI